jgi:hypothetical protein
MGVGRLPRPAVRAIRIFAMSRLYLGLSLLAITATACSDDGVASAVSSTSGGDGDPFMTTQPPSGPSSNDATAADSLTAGGTDADASTTSGGIIEDTTGAVDDTSGSSGSMTGDGSESGTTGGVPVAPMVGEVIITEIMQNPAVLIDSEGEWLELHNPGAASYTLLGCTVEGTMTDVGFTIDTDLVIAPGGYLTFATAFAGDQGFVADFQWDAADFQLNNTSDSVTLVCDGNTIDDVSYDNGATFPDPNGASMSLDPGSLDATANDDGTNWCLAITAYNGDLGTPGAANDDCA